ncbi:MAG: hypothetical protein GXO47_10820 [Chlorobi bacterium]|nr:hypothetical protein [Chlorobiota bacterium]
MKTKNYFFEKSILSFVMAWAALTLNAQIHISDFAGLDNMRNDPTNSYVLDNDIDMSGNTWVPFEFQGTLDGQGFMIKNLEYTNSDGENYGLFSVLSGATVSNLGLYDAYVEAPQNVGLLAGKTISATVTRCFAVSGPQGSEVYSSGKSGGLIGFAYQTNVSECYVENISVNGSDHVGGLIGHMEGGTTVQDCYCDATVYSSAWQVGGVVGWAQDEGSVITRCYGKGTVKSESGFTGGILGIADGADKVVDITECMALHTKLETVNPDIEKTYRIIANHAAATYSKNYGLADIELVDPYKSAWEDDSNGKDGASINMTDHVLNAQFYADSLPNWDFNNVWELTDEGPVLRMGTTTAIRNNKSASSAKVFAHGGVITVIGAEQDATIRIYNIAGIKLLDTKLKSSNEQFFNKGFLIIEIESDKTRSTYKIQNR